MISDYYTESIIIAAHSTVTSTSSWGTEPGYGTGTTIKAAVNPVAGVEIVSGDKDKLFADYKIFCSDTVTIAEGNRVTYGAVTLDVIFIKDTLNKGHHKLVYCKKR